MTTASDRAQSYHSLRDAPWQSMAARPLMIALQATCLVTGLWVIFTRVAPGPQWRSIPILILVAALLGVYTQQWLAQPGQRLVGKSAFTLAQLLVLLALLRVATWALTSWPTRVEAVGWLTEPWRVFDGVFLGAGMLCALAWHRAGVVSQLFQQLALTPAELAFEQERRRKSWHFGPRAERVAVTRIDLMEQYTSQWLIGGMFLAACAAVTRLSIDQRLAINILALDIPRPIIVASVSYFLLGLALTSQARLAVLRAEWLREGVELPPRLPSRWNRTSLLLILAVGLVAALLPLGSTWSIGAVVSAVLGVIVQIGLFIAFVVAAAFALIMRLFGHSAPMPEMPQEIAPVVVGQEQQVAVATLPPWLGGATWWLVVALALLLAARLLLRDSGLRVTRGRLRLVWERVWAALRGWGRQARTLAHRLPRSLPGRHIPIRSQTAMPPWRFVRVAGLSPREQVRYFYLSALHHAADAGLRRAPTQTPQEFMAELQRAWPEGEDDVQALTRAFEAARYDASPVEPDHAGVVKSIWQRVKRTVHRPRTPQNDTP